MKETIKEIKKILRAGIKKSEKKQDLVNLYLYKEIERLIKELEK